MPSEVKGSARLAACVPVPSKTFGDTPGPYVWNWVDPAPGGPYDVLVCAKEIPEPPAKETDWSDNALCTPYTLTITP